MTMKDTILSYIRSNRRAILYIIAAIIGIYALGRVLTPKDSAPEIAGETFVSSSIELDAESIKFIDASKFVRTVNGKIENEGIYVYEYPRIILYDARFEDQYIKNSKELTITSDGQYIIQNYHYYTKK